MLCIDHGHELVHFFGLQQKYDFHRQVRGQFEKAFFAQLAVAPVAGDGAKRRTAVNSQRPRSLSDLGNRSEK